MASEMRCASRSSCAWGKRLVKTEIEAAETLAAMRESGSVSGEKWSKKGKQDRPFRHKSQTSNLVSPCQDLSEGQAVVGQSLLQKICTTDTTKPKRIQQDFCLKQVKVEQIADLPKNSTACTANHSSFDGGKSRRNLTEEEKEAQRIRRVLANRESAKQTIRRRKALREELNRKAASLALENENLKREKELALKEYQSLEATNKNLKAQMAESVSTEVEETPVKPQSSVVEITASSSSNSPWFLYGHFQVTRLVGSSTIQSLFVLLIYS